VGKNEQKHRRSGVNRASRRNINDEYIEIILVKLNLLYWHLSSRILSLKLPFVACLKIRQQATECLPELFLVFFKDRLEISVVELVRYIELNKKHSKTYASKPF
jgi:hypothetical protein